MIHNELTTYVDQVNLSQKITEGLSQIPFVVALFAMDIFKCS